MWTGPVWDVTDANFPAANAGMETGLLHPEHPDALESHVSQYNPPDWLTLILLSRPAMYH
jgi:hypothetical protein